MFATKYLEKNKKPALTAGIPAPATGFCVVIPCYREPDILNTLNSLNQCDLPGSPTEVIVLINHPEDTSPEVVRQNHQTKKEIEAWALKNQREGLTFFAAGPVPLKKKWAGAGLARKTGMDEAIRRFQLINNPEGILISLDADTLTEKNYLTEIEKYFQNNPGSPGTTIAFSHQTTRITGKHLQGVRLYEKYMKYYKDALAFCGYPFPMFTVGSAFAVTARAYVRRGGMNRRKAGEDFYFLQNLAQMGPVGEITRTTVHPSARLSDRVPFGTGPVLQKWLQGEEDLTKTYDFQSFIDLKKLFDQKEKLFQMEKEGFEAFINSLPQPVANFLLHSNFWNDVSDLNHNCAQLQSFTTRFFQKFNAFKILKFLNYTHQYFYQKGTLEQQVERLSKCFPNFVG